MGKITAFSFYLVVRYSIQNIEYISMTQYTILRLNEVFKIWPAIITTGLEKPSGSS